MPLVIGLGTKKPDWKDPLGIYGGKAPGLDPSSTTETKPAETTSAPSVAAPDLSPTDRSDIVNTIIAEAAGEGPEGMAAVASVIRNRAQVRGKSPAEVVREPDQFTGYSAPGPDAKKAMEDPELRKQAESILDQVLAGALPDATGGADHYHATSVTPYWSKEMPKTADIGQHRFYRSEQAGRKGTLPSYDEMMDKQPGIGGTEDPFEAVLRGDSAPATAREPKGRGMADLLPDDEPEMPTTGKGGVLNFVHEGQDKLDPTFRGILEETSAEFGRPFTVNSGYRSPKHPVEARKEKPGMHATGSASDISMKGMNEAERAQLVRSLRAKGVNRFGIYKNSPDMLHVDMKDQTGTGDPWFMYNETNKLMGNAPAWFQEVAKNPSGGEAAIAAATSGVPVPGKRPESGTIVLDENFKPADGMNVFAAGGANPFQQMADEQAAQRAQQAAEKGEQFEQTRIRALNEMHNRDVGQQADALGAENPGRYGQIDEADLPAYQQQWEEENKSTGLAGDTGRILKAGAIGVGQSISSLADTVFSKIPGGDKFLEASDNIDRWVMGNTLDQKMENAQDKARASVTDRQQEADAKNWWDEEKGFFGPAWTDPRSYLRVVGESAPGTVVTMFPGGILARGAYVRALAGGATQRAAAATAARTATISGALIEGTMGGADSAKNVRDRIAAMPRDQLVSSDAVQDLINGGMSEEEAIKAISEDAASQAFVVSGVATGMFGGLGDRALAKIIAEGVGGGIAKRILAGGARGFVAEGIMEEAPQGAAQTMAENLAMQTVDPDQELTQGVGEAVAAGVAAGGVMGGGMGAAGGAASRAPAPAEAPPATDPGNVEFVKPPARGPIGRSVQRAEEEMQRRAPPAPVTAPTAAVTPTDGRPEVGATVRVDAEGMDPFMARIDGYEGDEAVVIDGGSGEVYQIPIGNLTPIAKSPEQLERENPSDKGVVPIDDEIPEMSTDPALEPLAPIATERTTGPLPPKKEQKSALERFPTAPDTGSRVIVDNEEAGRFPATVETWVENGKEVVVKDDQGNEYQVPASDLYVSKLTEKQVEKQELERNPPVEREQPEKTPTRRQLGERFVDLPDERHARLYDLARQRYFNKKTGESHLDLHRVDGPEHKRLADEFGVTTTAIGAMADDYRYRVERAAKEARSNLPVKMPPVNDKRLRQWQRDRAREQEAENAAPAAAADMADWWDLDLDDIKRRKILDEAGIKRSERMKWAGLGKGVQTKLEAMRNPVSPMPEAETPIETADAPIPAAATETMAAVDARANEAATSPENDLPEPTQAQKEAGNYKVGRMRVAGLDLSIENPAGSQRKGVDPNGKAWSVDMKSHYGYIRGTVGRDKDHIDTFVKPGITEIEDTAPVFVVDQRSGNGRFDEHKVMMGFDTLEQARAAYMENYAAGWKGLGDITQTSMGDFKQWLRSGKTTEPFAPKWFGSRDKAEAYVTKQGLTATHDVVESGKRFEVRERAQAGEGNTAQVVPTDVTFQTAKGSRYIVNSDGTTTRDKAYRPEHGEKEQGPQPTSDTTFYVDKEGLDKLGEFQTQGSKKGIVLDKGHAAVKYLDGPNAGGIEKRTIAKVYRDPAEGLYPVELWKDGARVHFGNAITSVGEQTASADPATNIQDRSSPAAIHKEMADRITPQDFARRVAQSRNSQEAAVIEPGGKLLLIKSTSNPDGDHAEFFQTLSAAGHSAQNRAYIRISSYGNQIGSTTYDTPSEAAAATLQAVKTSAAREGLTYMDENGSTPPASAAPAPEPARAAPSPAAPKKKLPLVDRLENYYRPGRNVESYGGETDRVISFNRGDTGTDWTVTVAEVRTDGTLSPERMHSTMPSEREMARWERDNPVPEKPKAPKQAKPKLEVSANTVFTDDAAEKARALLRRKLAGPRDSSVAQQGTDAPFHTPASLRNEIEADLSGSLISRLMKAGVLEIGMAKDMGPGIGETAWATRGGTIHLVADRIREGAGTAILLHEAFHLGRNALHKQPAWKALYPRLEALYDAGGNGRFLDAAREHVADVEARRGPYGPKMGQRLDVEEFGAYAVQYYEQAPGTLRSWVDDLIGVVKAWLLKRFGLQLGDVTPSELRGLAVAALRDAAANGEAKATADRVFSIGLDPELMQAGITLAGYHIEKGARTFAAYASAMIGDLGEGARPYLKSWYSAIVFDPRAAAFDGMTPIDELSAIDIGAMQDGADTTSPNVDEAGLAEPESDLASGARPADAVRPDPKMTGTLNDLKMIEPPARSPEQPIRPWAKETLLTAGKGSGHEYLMAVDADGTVVAYGSAGKKNNTGLNDELFSAMANPDRKLVLFHNHPRSGPLSARDIALLAMPGVHSVWAFGHNGSEMRASLAEGFDVPDAGGDLARSVFQLQSVIEDAAEDVRDFVRAAEKARSIDPDEAARAARHAPILVAAGAGLVETTSDVAYDPSEVDGLAAAVDNAAQSLAQEFSDGRRSQDTDARNDRPSRRVGHPAELEGMATGGERLAGRGPAEGGLSEASSANDKAERRFWKKVAEDTAPQVATKANVLREIKDAVVGIGRGRFTDAQPLLLSTVPLNYFPELAGGRMPALDDYLLVKRKMDAFRSKKHDAAAQITDRWRKVISTGYGPTNQAKAKQLADLMHAATLAGVDPSLTTEEERAKPGYTDLRRRFTQLPPIARELFLDVRDAYREQADETDEILLDNVRKAQQIALNRAEAEYREALEEIRSSKMDPIARRKAEEDAASRYKAESTKDRWRAKARMTKLRMELESSRVPAPYFPLARFGRYFVSAKDVEGNVLHFSRHETERGKQDALAMVQKELPRAEITSGVLEEKGKARDAMDPRLVADLEEMLKGADVDDTIRDALWQRYLSTLPDLSMRKRFIHRKGTPGFAQDAYRVFASTQFHGAHQMARLKYGLELQENLVLAKEQAQASDDTTRDMTLYNELVKRDEWVRSPKSAAWTSWLTSAAFVWYMGVSPAAALVNASQTVMLGVPILGARHGVTKSSAALLAASRDFVAAKGDLAQARGLAKDDRAAMNAFYESGLIDRTQSHDLAAVGETGTQYNPLRAKAMRAIGWAFHNVEVFNRSATALAAYRLARGAGKGHLEAINDAHDLTYRIHFDFANSSRPRLMQHDVVKVGLMFRSYQINMLFRLFRDVHQSFKGASPELKHEARVQLAGTIGMMSLMAGVTGTVGFGIATTIAGMFSGGDDPFDAEERFKGAVIEALGPELGGILLKGAPGHYLGVDLTSRIGMPDLWFRSSGRDMEGRDAWEYWTYQFLGASVAMGGSMVDGFHVAVDENNVARGLEVAAPKFVRDLMKAARYAGEGLESRRGDHILSQDDFSYSDLISQALGFNPAKVSETYERNNALINAEKRISGRRREIMNKFAKAVENGDGSARKEALAAVRDFNAVPIHRPVAITSETLKRSLSARARNRARRVDGILIQNEDLGRTLRKELPDPVYR